ncbi:MAG: RidA family protein [Gemmatimonadetes bacterium]|nr:RidA family protein [Gemmatimonadota bacterium]
MSKTRTLVHTDEAPAAVGPYSQATIANGFLFTAGQIALDPRSGKIVGTSVAEQTERVLANLGAILTAANTSFAQIVKTTVYLTDMAHFAEMNEAYARAFGDSLPARSTVAVRGLPMNVLVEIDAIALVP